MFFVRLASFVVPGGAFVPFVRELAAVIERAAILGNGRRLELRTALGSSTEAPPARPAPARSDTTRPPALAPQPSGKISSLDDAMAKYRDALQVEILYAALKHPG